MTIENPFVQQGKNPEQFPSKEEIKSLFEKILKGKEYKDTRELSDEEGIWFSEIEVTLKNGGKIEYSYQKAGKYLKGNSTTDPEISASIHSVVYDADGIPWGGDLVANYRNNIWEYLSKES